MNYPDYIIGATVFFDEVIKLTEQKTSWGKNEFQKELDKTFREFIRKTAENSAKENANE